MPTYRNITINLVSQFDILNIPEYAPPAASTDPFTAPHALADNTLVSCYVPTYPLSQFWFSYSISAPHPPKALYYFKLFINGTCTVSWGCGQDDDFKGRTMYGLFDSGERWQGETGVAVRAFGFARDSTTQRSSSNALGQVMEIKVYRAWGRKRIRPELEEFHALVARSNKANQDSQQLSSKNKSRSIKGGISMLEAGLLPVDHPQRYYTYSLLDPLDQPYATFRWHYHTWAQLEALGVTKPLSDLSDQSHKFLDQAEDEPSRPIAEMDHAPPSPEASISHTSSPCSASDISPLVIRGLSLSSLPLIDLPAPPQNPLVSALKRTGSPTPTSASTARRFAQLIRSSSRSPSPAKMDLENRPPSRSSLRRTASMVTLLGAVRGAIRRSGKGSSESCKGSEESESGRPHEDFHGAENWPLEEKPLH
ncbi:MAG: hypothetical protein Q9220_006028 [cf. Caloplaca sp. 1 TL-2023]